MNHSDVLDAFGLKVPEHRIDHFAPLAGMGFHDFPLIRRERAGLEQNAVRNGDFANIVQWCVAKAVFDEFVCNRVSVRQLAGDQPGVMDHALKVHAGFGVAVAGELRGRLDGATQRGDLVEFGSQKAGNQLGQQVEIGQVVFVEGANVIGVEKQYPCLLYTSRCV